MEKGRYFVVTSKCKINKPSTITDTEKYEYLKHKLKPKYYYFLTYMLFVALDKTVEETDAFSVQTK